MSNSISQTSIPITMNALERRASLSLAGIFALRMLGLFMILPVFSIYAHRYLGATPTLIGIALGIYGLTQACLQIPLGMWSDHIGRKPVIALGLVIFAVGSVIAASAHSIEGIIVGRALQGAGAIGSATMAFIADLTKEENRTKAMAIIGIIIGLSFSLAMVLGPVLHAYFQLSGIFWFTALLAITGIIILYTLVPTPQRHRRHRDAQVAAGQFKTVLKNPELIRLDIGIFCLHAILTASFIALPIAIEDVASLPLVQQWILYLPILLLAFITMLPLIIIAERKRLMKQIFLATIIALGFSELYLWQFHRTLFDIALGLFIFFTAFNLLEACLPSLISKIAPAGSKGTALGVYSSSQFLGIFVGGCVGGWLYGQHQLGGVFIFCALIAAIWFLLAATMRQPKHLGTFMLNVGDINLSQADRLHAQLAAIQGVAEVNVVADDGIAYLKVDNTLVDKEKLLQFSQSFEGE